MDTLQFRASMSEEESEAFTDQFTGRGSRAYKLRHHTLQAIAANPTHSSMRLRRIIRLMDKAFWKDTVPQKELYSPIISDESSLAAIITTQMIAVGKRIAIIK